MWERGAGEGGEGDKGVNGIKEKKEQFQHEGETGKKREEHDRAKKERDGKAYLRKKLNNERGRTNER